MLIARSALTMAIFHFTIAWAAPAPNDTTRAASLRAIAPEKAPVLEGEARRKTAIVIQGQAVRPFSTTNHSIDVVIAGQPGSHLGAAVAAAIDRRGYFLTAAHVAADEALSVVFYDGQRMRALPARVVAQMSNNHWQGKLDVAILHVDAALGEVFEWADLSKIHRSDVLMEIGRAKIDSRAKPDGAVTNGIIAPAAFAGTFKKAINLRKGGTAIRCHMPVRNGDSGGPLLTLDSKLVGIMCGSVDPAFGKEFAVANRPDLKWVNDVIDSDTPPAPSTTPFLGHDAGEPITITVPLLGR